MEGEKPDTIDSSTMDTDDSTDDQTTNFEHVNAEEDYEEEQTGNSVDPFELTQEEEAAGDKATKDEKADLNEQEESNDNLQKVDSLDTTNIDSLDSSSVGVDLNNVNSMDVSNVDSADGMNINVSTTDVMNVDSLDVDSSSNTNLDAITVDSSSNTNLDAINVDSSSNTNVEEVNNEDEVSLDTTKLDAENVDKNLDAENVDKNIDAENVDSKNVDAENIDTKKVDTENVDNKNLESKGDTNLDVDLATNTDSSDVTNRDAENVDSSENKEDLDNVDALNKEVSDLIDEWSSVVVNIQNVETSEKCVICENAAIVKYNYTHAGGKKYVCSDHCMDICKLKKDVTLEEPFKKFFIAPTVSPMFKHARLCKQCATTIVNTEGVISWEAMDFCKEACLYRYQVAISKACAECGNNVAYSQIGKYAVRFGCIVRQFCSGSCLETKKKKIRICSYCQKSIKRTKTTIGNKYFCDDTCKGMYENLQIPKRPPYLPFPEDINCFVCKEFKEIKIEFSYHEKSYYFCSPQCYTVFKFIQCSDTNPKKCHTCYKYTFQQYLEKHALYYDNIIHYFCSETCQHIYVITNRRVVPCLWCKVKKYNFDMIQKSNYMEATIYMCSIYCLNQFNASMEAMIGAKKKCTQCEKPGLYEMNIGGGATAAFCSHRCIKIYETVRIRPVVKRGGRGRKQVIPDKPGPLPVIANVMSLANSVSNNAPLLTDPYLKKLVIVQQELGPELKNVSTMVSSEKVDCGTEYDPIANDEKETQTDFEKQLEAVPIMVPIYIPAPFAMWSAPVPKAIPFPLIVPCPVLIPTTKKTSENILKEVVASTDTVKVEDPFEAELLMMAELVAAEKKEETEPTAQAEESPADPEQEDSLPEADQVEPTVVDLEAALEPATIRPTLNEHRQDEIPRELQRVNTRGRRRGRTPGRRGRRPANYNPVPEPEPEPEPVPQEPVEKPDANMCLKYTFGVNAWKQWVTSKNADLEHSCSIKLFKSELLQLTADELNYSLCLFVKEVRKPNGSEYAPDTIYYLCLGIQQYLYENGRIDNIFCDSYYEQFTECLDEICAKFSALYNDAHYIVTRVEEEHLWESKQLGAHSPHVLLSTLMFFNTKYFNLTSVEEHLQLSFSHIMKHWKRPAQPNAPKVPGSRNVLLRFYPPQSTLDSNSKKKKVYEQEENEDNPLRCPVKLYEFYLLKCPESVKTRNDVFYLLPERSCVPDSPVWYSTAAIARHELEKMLHRVKMVKEINVALLTN